MKKTIVCTIILFLLSSCTYKKSEIEEILIDNKWYYYPANKIENKVDFLTYIKFFDNGKCINYYVSSETEYQLLEITHDQDSNKWDYNQSTKNLTFFEQEYIIYRMVEDTIYLDRVSDHSKAMLFKYEN